MNNPFQHWYDQCNTGTNADKYAALPDFPNHIDVELTSTCNYRCLMCPTGNLSLERPGMFMAWETFEKIVAECEPHGTGIRFIGWGEPMLHPQFYRFLRHAADALLPTHLNTNGSKITENDQKMILGMGLDSIKFSFQGTSRESYAEMRGIDRYEALFSVIRTLYRRRDQATRPFISVSTTVTDEHPSTIEVFKKKFEPYCDQLSIGHTTFDYMDPDAAVNPNRVREMAAKQTVTANHPRPCPEVYDKLSIHADGSAHICCNDFNGSTLLGNINETDMESIWTHAVIERYREMLAGNEYNGPLCSNCYDYMELTNG